MASQRPKRPVVHSPKARRQRTGLTGPPFPAAPLRSRLIVGAFYFAIPAVLGLGPGRDPSRDRAHDIRGSAGWNEGPKARLRAPSDVVRVHLQLPFAICS